MTRPNPGYSEAGFPLGKLGCHTEVTMPLKTIDELFWSHVEKGPDCWLWTGKVDKDGYGYTHLPRQTTRKAHVVSWLIHGRALPVGMELHHRCRIRRCVNPDHCEPLTKTNHTSIRQNKTACPNGHAFTAENVYVNPTGAKVCRKCYRAEHKRWHTKNHEKVAARKRAARLAKKSHQFSTPAEVV